MKIKLFTVVVSLIFVENLLSMDIAMENVADKQDIASLDQSTRNILL